MQVGRVAAFGAALLVVAAAAAAPAYAGRGAYWGTSVEPEPGQSNLQAIRSLESEIGRYNRVLHRVARGVRHYRRRVYFSWNHEMQNTCNTGTPRQYRASYHRVHHIFRREHVRNAVWVWTPAAGNFNHDPAGLRRYLPRRYDLVGVDGYSRANPWRSATEIFSAAHRFAVKRWNVGVVIWTNSPPSEGTYRVDSSSAALAAYRAAGDMRYYRR